MTHFAASAPPMLFAPFLLALLAGCGGAADVEPAVAPPSSVRAAPTPTPSPTPAVMTIEEAAATYTELVTPSNETSAAVWDAAHDRASVSTIQKRATKATAAAKAFLAGLTDRDPAWPVEVQGDVAAVAQLVGADVTLYGSVAVAKSRTEIEDLLNASADGSNSAAQVLRSKLGLPAAPVD